MAMSTNPNPRLEPPRICLLVEAPDGDDVELVEELLVVVGGGVATIPDACTA